MMETPKRTLSDQRSCEKPERKKSRQPEDLEESLLSVNGSDIFEDPIDESILAEEETEDMKTEQERGEVPVNEDAENSKGGGSSHPSQTKGEKEKSAAKTNDEAKSYSAAAKRGATESDHNVKRAKRNERKSDYLITFTSPAEVPLSMLEKLITCLNDKIFSIVGLKNDSFIPRIDFARFQESEKKTIVGCADEETADWVIREAENFDFPLEVWDRRKMFIYHTHVPAPTSQMSNEILIKAIQITNSIEGRMVILKTEATKTGRVLVVGMNETALESFQRQNFEVHCGLFRLVFTPVKPKPEEEPRAGDRME